MSGWAPLHTAGLVGDVGCCLRLLRAGAAVGERTLGGLDKMLIDETLAGGEGGYGVVPYLPLNELTRGTGSRGTGGANWCGKRPFFFPFW